MEKKIVLNSFKNIAVIESTYKEKDELPLAYVCNAEKEDQILTGKNWAGRKDSKEPIIHYFNNEDFTLEIVTCPENSNQGGKLSFWICKLTTKDGYSFCTNINSLLLEYLLKECDFKKGVCQDKVFFVRNKSQLGLITKNGELYQQLLASDYMRENPKAKTDKYIPGDIVETLCYKYIYQGSLFEKFYIKSPYWISANHYTFEILIYKKPIEKHFYLSKSTWFDDYYNDISLTSGSCGSSVKDKYFITGHVDVDSLDKTINDEFDKDWIRKRFGDSEKCKELFKFRYSEDNLPVTDEEKVKEYIEFIIKNDGYYKDMNYEIVIYYK